MKVIHVVGARPNFMKIAPIMDRMEKCSNIRQILVHTGQHYDEQMSKLFFADLKIPEPDINLEVGSASHAVQTAAIMQTFEKILLEENPDLVVVVGDVNSTIACALTSVKLGVPVAHVEAGLRSFDRTMPEEINRILTDSISEFLFTTERKANENLLIEGIPKSKIHFVGNVMIDTLTKHREKAGKSDILSRIGIREKAYGLVTLHRPSNVDQKDVFENILMALAEISRDLPLIFPCHPRTWDRIKMFDLSGYVKRNRQGDLSSGINLIDPLGYLEFLKLMDEARIVLTDSGGIQEETTILGVPCFTLRENTERPVTVTDGTNVVVGMRSGTIIEKTKEVLSGGSMNGHIPELWDGEASARIVKILQNQFS